MGTMHGAIDTGQRGSVGNAPFRDTLEVANRAQATPHDVIFTEAFDPKSITTVPHLVARSPKVTRTPYGNGRGRTEDTATVGQNNLVLHIPRPYYDVVAKWLRGAQSTNATIPGRPGFSQLRNEAPATDGAPTSPIPLRVDTWYHRMLWRIVVGSASQSYRYYPRGPVPAMDLPIYTPAQRTTPVPWYQGRPVTPKQAPTSPSLIAHLVPVPTPYGSSGGLP